jgi:hypothetical protein
MRADDSVHLAERLTKLERELRAWRRLAVPFLVVLAAVVLLGAKATTLPDEIRARRFVVVGASGQPLIELGPSVTGATLALYDWKGGKGVELTASTAHAELVLLKDAVARVWLTAYESDSGIIVLDGSGNRAGHLSDSGVAISAGKTATSLATQVDGSVVLEFGDNAGRPRALLGLNASGTPSFGFYDEGGKPISPTPSSGSGPRSTTAPPIVSQGPMWAVWLYTPPTSVNQIPMAWKPVSGHSTQAECSQALAAQRQRNQNATLTCLPDTVDPRGPKAR